MKWKTVLGYSKPLEFETGVTTVYFRKNIVETKDKEGNNVWSYEEAQMTLAEYDEYRQAINTPNMKIVLERFENQEKLSSDSLLNQAAIMSETEYQTCLMELNLAI